MNAAPLTTRPALSRRRKIVYAVVAAGLVMALSFGALLAVDVYLHSRLQHYSGFNIWAYRGPTIGKKRPGELRVAVLGGSSEFGYGLRWDAAMPAVLQRALEAKRRAAAEGPATVANLAYNNEGSYSFKFTLKDYAYLDYDIASLHSGYNDLVGDPKANTSLFRHDSPIFRVTGYMPIFPMVFREKASFLLHGDINAVYQEMRGEKLTVFRPGLAQAATARALNAAATVGESLEKQIGRISSEPPPSIVSPETTGCRYPWGNYCRGLFDAIDYALAHQKLVLVVTEPYLGGDGKLRHIEQQTVMADALRRTYGSNPRVKYVNLGGALDVNDPRYAYDRMHLTVAGSEIVGKELADPIIELAHVPR